MKKIVSLLVILCMLAAVSTGCKSEQVNKEGASTNAMEGTDAAEGTDAPEEEPSKIVVALMCLAPMDNSKTDAVEAKVNELTLANINTEVDIQWYDAATYGTQVPLLIQAGEKLDLMHFNPVPATSFSAFKRQGQLMDITSYVEQYGADIKATLGEKLLKATSVNDALYGIGNYGPLAGYEAISMRKDILDQLGLTEKAQNMTTWSEYEEILKQVVSNTDLVGVINADAEGTVLTAMPYLNGGDSFADAYSIDTLGDGNNMTYADMATDKVIATYLSDSYYDSIKRVKDWYDKGLIYKDAATAKDYAYTLIKNGVGFSLVNEVQALDDGAFKAATGYDGILTKIVTKQANTGSMTKFGFSVPVTATEPEAAVKFLNLLYANQDLANLLTWGIEGTDWVKNDNGEAIFPDGLTAETVNYHTGDFLYGCRFFSTPWEGTTAIRETQKNNNKTMETSRYMGFSVDSSKVINEVTACFNVILEYKPSLAAGAVDDVDAVYAEFKAKLEAAGMNKIVAEYQSQLDGWLSQQ